ncbi:MAG: DegV family protein [Oscillibacter sp.]
MIKITTDSTCDLPQWLLEQHDISVIPLGIVKAGKLYRDGVDIHTQDIAAHVDAGGDITTTNAVNIVDYAEFFHHFLEKYDAVIHINIGVGFSSCHQNAKLAALELPEVTVLDSANLSTGHGFVVLAAAEAAEQGKSVSEISALVEALTPRVEASFVMDTLEYMKKGGRCSAVLALGANLLKLHPCIEVIDGKMSVTKKYRGSMEKAIADYVRERLGSRSDIDFTRAFLVDTCRTPGLVDVARRELTGYFDEVIETRAGCTIFCHCGPDTLGVMFARKA